MYVRTSCANHMWMILYKCRYKHLMLRSYCEFNSVSLSYTLFFQHPTTVVIV